MDNEFPKKPDSKHDETKTESDAEEEAMIDEAEKLRKEQAAATSQSITGKYGNISGCQCILVTEN